jgi:hypothetical protein
MKSKDQILLEDAYQKVLKEVVNSGEELPDLDMKMSTGMSKRNLDKFDQSNFYTKEDDHREKYSDAENIVDILGKYFKGKEANEDDYIYAGKELRKLGLTGSESDLENLNHAQKLAKHDEPPFDFDISAILDQIRGPLNYQDDVREL